MAVIENKRSRDKVILHCQHAIGRDKNNTSVLTFKDVSRKHAIIYWERGFWFLTDYSSNGTKVNAAFIHRSTIKLKLYDTIQFSISNGGIWQIIDLAPPASFLKAKIANALIDLNKNVSIPIAGGHQCMFFKNKHQKWVMDDGINETTLIHKQNYVINTVLYEFIENESLSDTLLNSDITKNACFQIFVSADEESITSKIKINDLELNLGNRVYNHILLFLVEVKIRDLNLGIEDSLCGWVDMETLYSYLNKELLKTVDAYYINTLIHRLRKNLMDLKPYGFLFTNIIERKKGKLRFGLTKFKIERKNIYALN